MKATFDLVGCQFSDSKIPNSIRLHHRNAPLNMFSDNFSCNEKCMKNFKSDADRASLICHQFQMENVEN